MEWSQYKSWGGGANLNKRSLRMMTAKLRISAIFVRDYDDAVHMPLLSLVQSIV